MPEESRSLTEGFTKQRRNLLVASLALLFSESAGLVVKQVNVLGNVLEVRDPSNATLFLWIAWAYFLLRYYQLLRDLRHRRFSEAFRDRVHELEVKTAERRFLQKYIAHPERQGKLRKPTIESQNFRIFRTDADGRELGLDFVVSFQTEDGRPESIRFDNEHAVLSRAHILLCRLRALLDIAFRTRHATEYWLPFAVALLPPLYRLGAWFMSIAERLPIATSTH